MEDSINLEADYKLLLSEVYNPIIHKVDNFEEKEIRDFFKVILDAAERSLRVMLSAKPPDSKPEYDFRKQLTKFDMDIWLRKVSLTLVSYSYYYYSDLPSTESIPALKGLSDISYNLYWQGMYDFYNKIFDESIGQKEIDYYAAGLKEYNEKGYSKNGDFDKVRELSNLDALTIASELLGKIWGENLPKNVMENLKSYQPEMELETIDPKIRRALFLGSRIWQVYQQIVQPYLHNMLYEDQE